MQTSTLPSVGYDNTSDCAVQLSFKCRSFFDSVVTRKMFGIVLFT